MSSSREKELNRAELEQLRSAFQLFDEDNDGKVSASQLKRALLDISKQLDQANCYRIILELENKGDSLISFHDFAALFASGSSTLLRGRQVSRKESQRLFRLIDVEQTGKISYRDLKRLTDELNEAISAEELEEMIHRADVNGDGFIDMEEFHRIISVRAASQQE